MILAAAVPLGVLTAACGPLGGFRGQETAPGGLAPTTVAVWFVDRNPDTDRVIAEQIIPAFKARFPQLTIEVTNTAWADHFQKLLTAAAAATMPDIAPMGAATVIQAAQLGLATPLDDRLKLWGVRDDFYPPALGQVTWQGKLLGLPYLVDARTYLWRRDLLLEAGITKLPETWEDALDAARRLTKIDGHTVLRRGLVAGLQQEFLQFMRAMDAPLVRRGKAVFNGPEGLVSTQFMVDRAMVVTPPGATVPSSPGNDLGTGLVAGLWSSLNPARLVKTGTPEQYPHVAVGRPLVPGGQRYRAPNPGKVRPVCLAFHNWFLLTAASKAKDQAWEFLKHLLAPEQLVAYDETLFALVTRKSASQRGFMTEEKVRAMADLYARLGRPQFKYVDPSRMNPAMGNRLTAATQGRISPKEALDEAVREWDQIMQEANFTGDSD